MGLAVMLPQALEAAASPTFATVTLSGDLRVDGGDIGLTADADLIQIAANSLTLNGDQNVVGHPAIRAARLCGFVFIIQNTAGVIQHLFRDSGVGTDISIGLTKITGASSTAANTPTVEFLVDFVSGAGLASGTLSIVVWNTAAQTANIAYGVAAIAYNDAGTAVTARLELNTRDVNATSRLRWELQFFNATSGAAFNINTTNIAAGKQIQVAVLVWII